MTAPWPFDEMPTKPQPAPDTSKPGSTVGWIIAVILALLLGRTDLILPPSDPPEPPPVVEPGEPVDPGDPDEPTPGPDEPTEPDDPALDGTAVVARDEARLLPVEVRGDIAAVGENFGTAATLIREKHIRSDVECQHWMWVENRRDFTDEAAWEPWRRAIQTRLKAVAADGKMENLGDWAREFDSIQRGLEAAAE